MVEVEASNTTENVIASALVLQRENGLNRTKRILVVSSPFQRPKEKKESL
jgi:uncharacterized SAM-binding protein YcdF (DUF218 family)